MGISWVGSSKPHLWDIQVHIGACWCLMFFSSKMSQVSPSFTKRIRSKTVASHRAAAGPSDPWLFSCHFMSQSPLEISKRAESDWSLDPSEASQLDPELIRSVPLETCLAGWGKHFRTSGAQGRGDYELSQVTDHIDDFLSHDWKTSRFDKVLAMLWTFNCWAALVSSTLVSCLTGVLRIYANSDLGNHWWPVCFGYLAYGFTLCFWQRIRSFWKSRQVFLDRLCISQEDEVLKRQGSASIGVKVVAMSLQPSSPALQILRDFRGTPKWMVYNGKFH